jgi:hypothetical protein
MERIAARPLGRVDDLADVQVALGRFAASEVDGTRRAPDVQSSSVGIGVDRDGSCDTR